MLKKYDNKLVRIECIDGNIYEGYCTFNDNEYNYHEYNRDEEGLQILIYLFFKSDIKDIKVIDEFTDKYGTLEKEIVNELDFVEDIFESEYNEHIIRLLLCIKDNYKKIKDKEGINNLLKELLKNNKDKEINKITNEILNK